MKYIAPVVAPITALIFAFATAASAAETHTVSMKSISYDPKTVEIKAGDSIEWKNISYTEHSATADDGKAFDTGMVQPKKVSKRLEFSTPGTFPYHCSMHGRTMSGQVVVKP